MIRRCCLAQCKVKAHARIYTYNRTRCKHLTLTTISLCCQVLPCSALSDGGAFNDLLAGKLTSLVLPGSLHR